MKKLGYHWNRFFFEPISPATIGLFRIFFGATVFLFLLGKFPSRELFYGDNGLVSVATTGVVFDRHAFLYFRWVPGSDPGLAIYFGVIMLATLSLIVGFKSRVSSVIVFLGIISLSNRNYFVDNAGDDLLRINCFFLMFSQAAQAFSVDRYLRRRKGLEGVALIKSSPWAQRLLQLQLAYLYFETWTLKLPGAGWQDGTALYYALNYLELRRFQIKFLFYFLWQIKLMTWGVMIGELCAFSLIWFRKLRYPVLLIAFSIHFGINLVMQFPIFQYVMMTSLINFIFPEDVERWVEWLQARSRATI